MPLTCAYFNNFVFFGFDVDCALLDIWAANVYREFAW